MNRVSSKLFLFEVLDKYMCIYDVVLFLTPSFKFKFFLYQSRDTTHYEIFPEDVGKFNEYIQDPLFEVEVEKFLIERNLKRL